MTSEYKVDVPEGQSGPWKVERFEVTPSGASFEALRMAISSGGRGRRCVPEGTYTRLTSHRCVVMSDTPDEIRDHLKFIRRAEGRVLIHGLGLGMCLQAVARKPGVEHVLAIELSQDVIDLVAPHYRERFGDKIEVRQGDALTWKPERGQRWDCVWHDIWPTLCTDHLEEMKRLHRRFGRRCDWQGSWGRGLLEDQARREQRRERLFSWRP